MCDNNSIAPLLKKLLDGVHIIATAEKGIEVTGNIQEDIITLTVLVGKQINVSALAQVRNKLSLRGDAGIRRNMLDNAFALSGMAGRCRPLKAWREWHLAMKCVIVVQRARQHQAEQQQSRSLDERRSPDLYTRPIFATGARVAISSTIPASACQDSHQLSGTPAKQDQRFNAGEDQYRHDLGIVLVKPAIHINIGAEHVNEQRWYGNHKDPGSEQRQAKSGKQQNMQIEHVVMIQNILLKKATWMNHDS